MLEASRREGIAEGITTGIAKERSEGERAQSMKIAQSMRAKGYSIKETSMLIGLLFDEVQRF